MGPEHRDCAAVDEMLPAYAMNALDDADRAMVDAHLLSCDRHEDAAAWGEVALRLSDLAPEVTPPEGLRERVLAIPSAAAAGATGAEASPIEATEVTVEDVPAPLEVPPAPVADSDGPVKVAPGAHAPRDATSSHSRLPWVLTAVFAALAVFFAGWTVVLMSGSDGDEEASSILAASASEGGIEARASYLESEQVALVSIDGLSDLPEGSDYQLWAIGPEAEAEPAGILQIEDDSALVAVPGVFEAGWSFAVTIEPAGGSTAPTSDPIVEVTL